MGLSSDLISQFVKATTDNKKTKTETIVYGTTVEHNGSMYVKLDGSDLLTPVSATADTKTDERVTVMIKNHTATITGNASSPSARKGDMDDVNTKISEFEFILASEVTVDEFNAEKARIDVLVAENATIKESLSASQGSIAQLEANDVDIYGQLNAHTANITSLTSTKIDVAVADARYATITDLESTNASIYNLESTYGDFMAVTSDRLDAADAFITNANLTYANIDFSNIGSAAMEYLYSQSGLIENVVVGDGTITGNLVGVTLKGDLIEGNTIVADKLVILGEDGLYYKLNTNGITTESEQTEYNSLNGSVITAKSITATQINVDDLVAFDATIGGFNITESAIYSEVKDDEGNTTRGVYMDKDGQINFGDESNFIKYYRDEDGTYKLAISAASILYSLNGKQYSIADLGTIGEYIHINTYEDEPCIELGEVDSDFKLRITNTRIIFTEGSNIPAYFTNQSMHIKKAVIEEELQQGGFVWKARGNGNLGLVWKGGT